MLDRGDGEPLTGDDEDDGAFQSRSPSFAGASVARTEVANCTVEGSTEAGSQQRQRLQLQHAADDAYRMQKLTKSLTQHLHTVDPVTSHRK